MKEKGYQGWANYETWCVALWLDNEQGSYQHWREQAKRFWSKAADAEQVKMGIWSREDAAKFTLSDQLKKELEDASPLSDPSVYSDLLSAALGEVDWSEIAAFYLAEEVALAEPEEGNVQTPEKLEVLYQYSRGQAINDGVLIDVSAAAKEAGIKFPTVVTAGVWAECIAVPKNAEGQDEAGRLWDVLTMLRTAIARNPSGSRVDFSVAVQTKRCKVRMSLYSLCHPGDKGEPVITVMLPHED